MKGIPPRRPRLLPEVREIANLSAEIERLGARAEIDPERRRIAISRTDMAAAVLQARGTEAYADAIAWLKRAKAELEAP